MAEKGAELQNYNNELVKCEEESKKQKQKQKSETHSIFFPPFSFALHFDKGIEDLKTRRDDLNRQILKEEEEREKLSNEIKLLKERHNRIEVSLASKYASREDFNKTIQETEAAYVKVRARQKNKKTSHSENDHQILESSQTLLQLLKRETVTLAKRKQGTQS